MVTHSIDSFTVAFDLENIVREDKVKAMAVAMGKHLSEKQLSEAYLMIQHLFKIRDRVYYKEVEAIFDEQLSWPENYWQLKGVKVKMGKDTEPQARLKLIDPNGEEFSAKATGDTTVDAIFTVIEHVTGIHSFILDFNFSSIVPGVNALGQASVRIKHHNIEVIAEAYSVDFIEAVAKAFIVAISKVKAQLAREAS